MTSCISRARSATAPLRPPPGGARLAPAAAGVSPRRAEVRTEMLDVSDGAAVERVAGLLEQRHDGVDIVFSNAYRRVQPTDDFSVEVADYVETNNVGTTRMMRAFG